MLESIGNFVGGVAIYIAALLGVVAVYFLWVAFREWRAGARAAFGIERDIATSEMVGAVVRAAGVVILGVIVLALGQVGQQVGESGDTPPENGTPRPTAQATNPVLATSTPQVGEVAPTQAPTGTSELSLTDVPLPTQPASTSVVEPTPQIARVTAFGGVWLRDAPNGGTIDVLPQGASVEFLEGREFAGSYDWQQVRVLNAPAESQALVGQEGWVAAQFLEVTP
jgi:hypothetical protein